MGCFCETIHVETVPLYSHCLKLKTRIMFPSILCMLWLNLHLLEMEYYYKTYSIYSKQIDSVRYNSTQLVNIAAKWQVCLYDALAV